MTAHSPTSRATSRATVFLQHVSTNRLVPVEVPTVFGRSPDYYRYDGGDERPDRLEDQVETLGRLNYIQLTEDGQVSRTHGLVDPGSPEVADLNSTNGTLVNGDHMFRVPTRRALADGDEIAVGRSRFRVVVRRESDDEVRERVGAQRHALVAHAVADENGDGARHRRRAARVHRHLLERKSFVDRSIREGGGPFLGGLRALREDAHEDGVAVISIHASGDGNSIDFGDEKMAFDWIVEAAAGIPGRVVLILDLDEDPTRFERAFADRAWENMILLSVVGEVDLDDSVPGTGRCSHIMRVAHDSMCGKGPAGVLDDAVDGIEALIPADTNRLDVDWVASYRGRLNVVVGERVPRAPDRIASSPVSHSIRMGSSTFLFRRRRR